MSTAFTDGEREVFYQLSQRLEQYQKDGSFTLEDESDVEGTRKAIADLIEAVQFVADRLQNPELYR